MLTLTPGSSVRLAGAQWLRPAAPIRLGQADSATTELQGAVAEIAQALLALSDRLQKDTDLALDPTRFAEVPVIGEAFLRPQVLETIDKTAEQISSLTLGVLTPPLGPYATAATAEILSEVDARMKAVRASVAPVIELVEPPIGPDDQALADAYIDSYMETVSEVVITVEKLVVIEESGNVDVYEPDEKNGGADLFVVAGVAAVVVLLVVVS